jgi:type II secretory pathway pseudopilin PulG
MKPPSSRRKRGIAFTLVELLVVIGIIAILVGVVLAGVSKAIQFAKRTKANAMAVNIQTAVQNYYTEYGVYPTQFNDPANADAYYSGATGTDVARWSYLIFALCGNVNPYTGVAGVSATATGVPNTRGIAYLSPTRSDLDANGILQNPFGSAGTSAYFYMVVDTDYSGIVGDTSPTKLPDFTKYPTNYMGATVAGAPGGVAVWCPCDQPLVGTTTKPSPANFWAHTY